VETPRVDPGPRPPDRLVPRVTIGEGVTFPDEFLDQDPPNSVIKVFRFLAGACARFGMAGTWVYQTTIAKGAGLGESTVRVALHWLRERGWVDRSDELIRGEEREMIWCLWLLRAPLESGDVDFGRGFKYRIEDGQVVPPKAAGPRPMTAAPGAAFCDPGADPGAQDSAPENSNGDCSKEPTFTFAKTRLSPGEGGGAGVTPQAIAPPPAPTIELPAAPAPADDQVRKWIHEALSPGVPGLVRKLAIWALEDCGRLPAELVGKVPSRPADNPAPAPRPAAPPPPSTTEDLLRRIAEPCGPEAVEAKVDELARRLAEEFDDWGSVHGFKPRLRQAATREIPVKAVVGSYKAARKSVETKKGAIFHFQLNQRLGGAPR
jgi:hypothetical protein